MAGVKVDSTSLWHSIKGVATRLVIEPLKGANHLISGGYGSESETECQTSDNAGGSGSDSDAAPRGLAPAERSRRRRERERKQLQAYSATEGVVAMRMAGAAFGGARPSQPHGQQGQLGVLGGVGGGGGSLLPPFPEPGNHGGGGDDGEDDVEDGGGQSSQANKPSRRRRFSGEMGAQKLAKTPKGKKRSSHAAVAAEGGKSGDKEKDAKAEVGSAIDLRKLSRAKKVQVFRGPTGTIMVVGQRRLVVITPHPTPTEPHQGVVVWMSALENVASIALEIQPMGPLAGRGAGAGAGAGSGAVSEPSVALHVAVKEGSPYTFVMGVADSTLLVQSIYARLNGEEPPPMQQRGGPSEGGGGSGGGGNGYARGSGGGGDAPRTPSSKSSRHKKTPSSRCSHRKDRKSSARKGTGGGGGGGGGGGALQLHRGPSSPASPSGGSASDGAVGNSLAPRGDLFNTSTPPKGGGGTGGMASPLRIVLSPTGRGKKLSLQVTSISNGDGTLSLGPGGGSNDGDGSGGGGECGAAVALLSRLEATVSAPALSAEDEAAARKYRGMLKAGVPAPAVQHKMAKDGVAANVAAAVLAPEATSTAAAAAPAAAAPPGNSLSPEEEAQAGKYRGMLKAGVPNQAVRNKMSSEGLAAKLIEAVCGLDGAAPAAAPASSAAAELSPEDEAAARKYRGMLKAGVPAPAVQHKMTKDGLAAHIMAAVCGPCAAEAAEAAGAKATAAPTLTAAEEAQVGKYRGMLKAGVPNQAVRNKMSSEGLAAKLIEAVCGLDRGVATGGTEKWGGREGKVGEEEKVGANGARPNGAKPSNLLTLHWTPLGLSEEEHSKSIWATNAASMGGSPDKLQRLELLFSKKPAAAKAAEDGGDGADGGGEKKKRAKKRPAALDNARMQNLAIGLRSFKAVADPEEVGALVARLAADELTAEQVARLEEMLPTDAEVKAVAAHAAALAKDHARALKDHAEAEARAASEAASGGGGAAAGVAPPPLPVALLPAEAFVRGFEGVARPRPKLAVLTLMVTLAQQQEEVMGSLAVLRRAFAQCTGSGKLQALLAEILAVGNIMNAGTAKGGAMGITVESLLKLTQTRSACGGMTVLDYITDALMAKQAKALAARQASLQAAAEARRARALEASAADASAAEACGLSLCGGAADGSCASQQLLDRTLGNVSTAAADGSALGGGLDATALVAEAADATALACVLEEEDDDDDDAAAGNGSPPGASSEATSSKGAAAAAAAVDLAAPLDFHADLPDLDAASRLPLTELAATVAGLRAGLGAAKRELVKLLEEASAAEAEAKAAASGAAVGASGAKVGAKVGVASAPASAGAGEAPSDPRAALMAMLQQRGGGCVGGQVGAGGGGGVREVPRGRGEEVVAEDERRGAAATKAAAEGAGLRATAALASDPRAGLMAALRARRGDDEDGQGGGGGGGSGGGGVAAATGARGSSVAQIAKRSGGGGAAPAAAGGSATEAPAATASAVARPPCAERRAAEALEAFLGGGEALVASVEAACAEAKVGAEGMAVYFGEKGGADASGHVFECLRQFSAMTREARAKAEVRAKDAARKARLAAREAERKADKAAAGGGGGGGGGAGAEAASSSSDAGGGRVEAKRDIDPKAGLMAQIRRHKEARLDASLS